MAKYMRLLRIATLFSASALGTFPCGSPMVPVCRMNICANLKFGETCVVIVHLPFPLANSHLDSLQPHVNVVLEVGCAKTWLSA